MGCFCVKSRLITYIKQGLTDEFPKEITGNLNSLLRIRTGKSFSLLIGIRFLLAAWFSIQIESYSNILVKDNTEKCDGDHITILNPFLI